MDVPPVERMCTTCRGSLGAAEPCRQDRRRAVFDLGRDEDRARLRDVSWYEAPTVPMGNLDTRLILGVLALLWPLGCFAASDELRRMGFSVQAGLALVVGGWVAMAIAYVWLRRTERWSVDEGLGTARECPVPQRAARGSALPVVSPDVDGDEPLAVGVTLTTDEGAVTLRHGWTRGLTLELDDGDSLHLPSGLIRIEGAAPRPLSAREARTWAERCGLSSGSTEGELIPASGGEIVELRAGGRVAVHGRLEADVQADHTGYRAAPTVELRPVGAVTLVVEAGENRDG